MKPSRNAFALALVLAALPGRGARAQALSQGFELERAGRLADAANLYVGTLRADPANLPALLGLERVLPSLNRVEELLPLVQRARQRAPQSGQLRSLELRTYAALNEPDSLAAAAQRWADSVPGSEAPYREWGLALADRRAWDEARRAYLLGRRVLANDAALATEVAELEQRAGNWEGAAREWGRAVARTPDQLPNAAAQLEEAPTAERDRVSRALTLPDAPVPTRRLGAELLLDWGRATEAWTLFESTLGPPSPGTQGALRRFADLASALPSPEGHRVRGLALMRWAELVPSPLAERARAEAVRELLAGGDRAAARLALEHLVGDSLAPGDAQATAAAGLLEVLIADGQLDVAERRLAAAERGGTLGGDDREALRLALSRARVARGELDRAVAALGDDSSVAAIAQRGWIALYRGDLSRATQAFRNAGPFAGGRAASTERTAMLVVLLAVGTDSSPELGAALLTLARGDSASAIGALRRVAGRLPADAGRPEVLLLAGQVAVGVGAGERRAALAILADLPADTLAAWADARARLVAGDSLGAIERLRARLDRLKAAATRADLGPRINAMLARLTGTQDGVAADLFAEVVRTGGTGAAPAAADLEWARLLVSQRRLAEAVQRLEHLILTYPESAFAPDARRELERARGAIPRS